MTQDWIKKERLNIDLIIIVKKNYLQHKTIKSDCPENCICVSRCRGILINNIIESH